MNGNKRMMVLQEQHASHEKRLKELEKMRWHSEEVQREISELKKKKLMLRDEMESLRNKS